MVRGTARAPRTGRVDCMLMADALFQVLILVDGREDILRCDGQLLKPAAHGGASGHHVVNDAQWITMHVRLRERASGGRTSGAEIAGYSETVGRR